MVVIIIDGKCTEFDIRYVYKEVTHLVDNHFPINSV